MNIRDRIAREIGIMPLVRAGYERSVAAKWRNKCILDKKKNGKKYDKSQIQNFHQHGFLCSTVEKYHIEDVNNCEYISELDYLSMQPFNNVFEKWVTDIITTERVLFSHHDVCRKTYFSIIQREGKNLILPIEFEETPKTVKDVISCLKEHEKLEMRPSFWTSDRKRYQLSFDGEKISVNDQTVEESELLHLINGLKAAYVIADPVSLDYGYIGDVQHDHAIKVWVTNDAGKQPAVLAAMITLYTGRDKNIGGKKIYGRKSYPVMIDAETGCFEFGGSVQKIENWEAILEKVKCIASDLKQISYFTMSISLNGVGPFTILHFNTSPVLPPVPYQGALNTYLKERFAARKPVHRSALAVFLKAVKKKLKKTVLLKSGRKGIREYMQELWVKALIDDALHTKGISLSKKIWAWKKGFLSFRIWQYGLTEENYNNFLSDYDYHWLNRINNVYQKWVNDKTTYRLVLEPLKQYLPEYYFSVYATHGKLAIAKMPDCPADVPDSFDGVLEMLRRKGKLAFKASAGTHGDGFYCLAYSDGQYFINGENADEAQLRKTLSSQKSFYIVTEYLVMHEQLRKIYDKSVNTIRVMVINEHGHDPKIMQTYMRIGSSRTGFTDNVGYGGICAMVDMETGKLYNPETLRSHVYYECPKHPDTGVEINEYIPRWDELKKVVLKIAGYVKELEYLGFDVVVTEKGIEVLEINIHQDLHKVADHTPEIREFYKRKIARKRKWY